ncbi:conserved Plasmodium protein, unknown function [Plasmodium berghei]|uniref:Uncharacterized protein n=2 Tax=Plasmodium berghei TaxID=5821 RepID=A0A509AHB4_PLABA|nr:conserved Plasmodium protein, unknown function [Plasmodium berghei ANKA]SCM21524.1 conserved Plasmodium protein, unknown function [Plasmodium berghei]SCN24724.1 conserved Plasmodium protein, unknown function [Plasmodium berghei]SCO59865.1 conserved Plasmodium protein, unknown function [Plasmodium berghei]SCO61178.1 conserved Plasmodium protein, unknown function [Plasmodium berghei]VUC55450.1 conserved Plasmodium protein, unknown function [Plasmodium berghei ANKA]|eukprot:XP_034421263.1 conserved Plasmodium protein, unknown function [Plasmodium berghei ANKA]
MLEKKDGEIIFTNTFCATDNEKITSVLEFNNIKIQGYIRNIRIEDLKYLRSIETLNLANFYLLYFYLKDIYYIFFHFICDVNKENLILLKKKDEIKNYFIFNTKIENYDIFINSLKLLFEKKWEINKRGIILDAPKDSLQCVDTNNKNEKNNVNSKQGKKGKNRKNGPNEKNEKKQISENENKKIVSSPYINQLLDTIYTEDKMQINNIDKLINDKIKKENIFENNFVKLNNNFSIYKLSYLYFNDKLKRIRLDYNFHLILSNKIRYKEQNKKKLEKKNKQNTTLENTEQNLFHIYERLYLLYASHFKYYIFSFFLYFYIKYTNASYLLDGKNNEVYYHNNRNRNNNNKSFEFMYNHDDNLKNLSSVISHILTFINNVLNNLNNLLNEKKISIDKDKSLQGANSEHKIYTIKIINKMLKTKLFFKYIKIEHIDITLSCIVLVNIYSQDYAHSYFYLNNIYTNLMHAFPKYNASISLWKHLRRANYFRFFTDMEKISLIERFSLFFNLKNIRLDYLYSILKSANNRNKYSINIKLIDECLYFHNIERTTHFLNCLQIQIKNEKMSFNMSNREALESNDRCFLLDNKNECIQNFFKTYKESIEDYTYIIYQEKKFDHQKCFSKFDIPNIICFGM